MSRAELLGELDRLMREAPQRELPALVGHLVELEERARLRLRLETAGNGHRPEPDAAEVLLTPEAAVDAIGGSVSRKWLLRHTRGLRFRRDLSRKVVRFEKPGLLRWAGARRG